MLGAHIRSLLSQNGWLLNLVFISLGAYFTAGAANAVVAHQVRVVPTAEDLADPSDRGERGDEARETTPGEFRAMAQRNLFGVKRENLSPVVVQEEQTGTDAEASEGFDENELQRCSMSAQLRATLVFESAPEWSIAVLNSRGETSVHTIHEGSNKIEGDTTLVDIRSREVIVRRRDQYERCWCEGEGGDGEPDGMLQRSRSVRRDDGGDEDNDDDDDDERGGGVTRVSESEYQVDRAEVDSVLSNLSKVATQARIVPSFKNGKPNGFKLFSIKPGSIYSKIGLQNGDVVQKVNGYEINSPDKALEIYQKLKEATSLSVDVTRRGRPQHFNYSIR